MVPKLKAIWSTLEHLVRHQANIEQPLGPVRRFVGWQILKRAQNQPIIISAFDGARLHCHPSNTATNAVIYYGWPDWSEMQLLRKLLRPGDNFLTVGPTVAVYSMPAS